MRFAGVHLIACGVCFLTAQSWGADKNRKSDPWTVEARRFPYTAKSIYHGETMLVGTWLEVRVKPESIADAAWVVDGPSRFSNQFGIMSILVGEEGPNGETESTFWATSEDHFPGRFHGEWRMKRLWQWGRGLVAKKSPSLNEHDNGYRVLMRSLPELDALGGDGTKVEEWCENRRRSLQPWEHRSARREVPMTEFAELLGSLDYRMPQVPHAKSWALVRCFVLEAASLQLAECLDGTHDKARLSPAFWKLFHGCLASLQSIRLQFEDAGGEANTKPLPPRYEPAKLEHFTLGDGNLEIQMPAPDFGFRKPIIGPEERRNAVAQCLHGFLPDLRVLLYVQIRDALSGVPEREVRKVMGDRGFVPWEMEELLGK